MDSIDQLLIKKQVCGIPSIEKLAINLQNHRLSKKMISESQLQLRRMKLSQNELNDPVYQKIFDALRASSLAHNYWWASPETNLLGYRENGANALRSLATDIQNRALPEYIYLFIEVTEMNCIVKDLENKEGTIQTYYAQR